MIIDWFHRKFIEKFLECENGNFRRPISDTPINKLEMKNELFSKNNEHRYRYYIPEVMNMKNSNDLGMTSEQNKKSNSKQNTKIEHYTTPGSDKSKFSQPELYSPIKKFYIITSDKKSEAEVLKLGAAFARGVCPPNIRKFLVVPLPEDTTSKAEISNPDKDLAVSFYKLNKQPNELDDTTNRTENGDILNYERSLDYFDDIFEEEKNSSQPIQKTEEIRDSLITRPSDRFEENTLQILNKNPLSSAPTIDLIYDKTEHKSGNLWRQSEVDGTWWCDLIDLEVPITCKSLRSKPKKAPTYPETKGIFGIIYEKLSEPKKPEHYDEFEW